VRGAALAVENVDDPAGLASRNPGAGTPLMLYVIKGTREFVELMNKSGTFPWRKRGPCANVVSVRRDLRRSTPSMTDGLSARRDARPKARLARRIGDIRAFAP